MKLTEQYNEGDKYFDLTQSQLLIWTGQQMSPNSPMYNMALTFELAIAIDVPIFQKAFQILVQQCDAMRTVFVKVDGQIQQKITASFSCELSYLDFSDKKDVDKKISDWAINRSQNIFDITNCLFDAVLLKIEEEKYVWYFNQHHLITDAWAITKQYESLINSYKSLSEGLEISSTPLPLFERYIQFEANHKTIAAQKEANKYWEDKAADLPDPPSFYGHLNRERISQSERISITLSKEKSDLLRSLTMESDLRTWTQDLSLFSIFSTIVFSYLYRITGQQRLTIGTPAHNRTTKEFKETPGLFIELFPMMVDIDPTDSFSSLFQKTRDESLSFLRYAQAGLSSSDLNRRFNVVLNYINASFKDVDGIPAKSEWIHTRHADPGHHMRIQVYDFDASGCIELGFDLNNAIFNEQQRAAAPDQFVRLIDSFLADRFQPIGKPSLLATNEITTNTAGSFDFQQSLSIINLFETTVDNNKDQLAISFDEETMTYATLDAHVNQLANYLIQNGLKQEDRVAIFLTRSPAFIISVLAILKAGATFVPIPTNYPSGRVLAIIEDAKAKFVISNSTLAAKLRISLDNLINLDKEAAFINQLAISAPNIDLSQKEVAYIIYTSGSTGQPKGVMINHRSLSHYIQWATNHYVDGFSPIVPLFTAVGFDLTITSIFLPLACGGQIISYQEPDDGPDLSVFQVLEDNQVNFIKLTPSHLSLLKGKSFQNSGLKTMIVGGENFATDIAQFVQNNFNSTLKIYNEYGPTEATVGCIVHQFDPQKDHKNASVPIGQVIDNTQVYILDDYLNPVPDGVAGELYISGVGLAKGYWQQEVLTKKQFIPNPFLPNTLMYRTGDLVRKNSMKDYYEYLGRRDLQVKIRGRRVELAEIEHAINQYPNIEKAIVDIRHRTKSVNLEEVHNCTACGLPSNYPNATFDEDGVCHLCQSFTSYQEKVKTYFKTKTDFKALFDQIPTTEKGEYDCLMLLSGGKDSSYALAQLREMGLSVLAFTLDNGYISEGAKDNIRRIVKDLGVDHIFGETEAMNAIFVDSLQRHCNVCDGCFKTIYTLSVQIALEKKIPYIITGLSRGQFFETRLTEELFRQEVVDVDKIDEMILNARKAYHQVEDAVTELLDVSMFEDDAVFEKVKFLDFYRYTDVSLDEMLDYLDNKLPWVRPSDTGRSTNCLINQAGIYVHKKELGYSNYAFPYSWDVRIGHKTRQASLDEINEEIDEQEVNKILSEIGYAKARAVDKKNEQLVAYYVSSGAMEEAKLRSFLKVQFPDYMIPVQFIPIDYLPLTINGKIDHSALPEPDAIRPVQETLYVAAQTEFEEIIQATWSEVMQIDKIGIHDNFIEIGGDSLTGIRIISRLKEDFELDLPVNLIFQKPTIAELALSIEDMIKSILEDSEYSNK